MYVLQRHFRDKWPSSLKAGIGGWIVMDVNLTIGPDSIARVASIKADDFEQRKAIANAVRTMPKWTPGTFDGKVSDTNYKITLVLTQEGLYLAELLNTRRGITPPNSPTTTNRRYAPR
jgi:hypothetical protein